MNKPLKIFVILTVLKMLPGCATVSMTPLSEAAKNGDLATVKSLLAKGASACEKGGLGFTPYQWALNGADPGLTGGACKSETFKFILSRASDEAIAGTDCPGILAVSAAFGCDSTIEYLLDHGIAVENAYSNLTALGWAAFYGHIETAKILLSKGADLQAAIACLKDVMTRNEPYLDSPLNKKSWENAGAGVALLNGPLYTEFTKIKNFAEKQKITALMLEAEKANETLFQAAVKSYQKAAVKPELSEEARKYKVQAEGSVRDKEFPEAAEFYDEALKLAPWWAEGHFNRALVLGEAKEFTISIIEMKRYLLLAPKAPNARAAQDKIYDWERKIKK